MKSWLCHRRVMTFLPWGCRSDPTLSAALMKAPSPRLVGSDRIIAGSQNPPFQGTSLETSGFASPRLLLVLLEDISLGVYPPGWAVAICTSSS
ncbi:hypothetical protein BO78DRAFT_25522 [Aspergillus sclerotiicarbonarius CBS 121057]|uniref:Uncharacterized protein n=1 Tax=Aspergillus sclerotiicarbonarius (strain CBS 121057 / IBT 28362) TaxID=1448318 RepID=A0A319DUN0_ASPSB|nr:hypothetical protein BO78DRAFT_25522 [Aspergillus sclerotiicarbonarius CBS 121057]